MDNEHGSLLGWIGAAIAALIIDFVHSPLFRYTVMLVILGSVLGFVMPWLV